MAGAFAYAALDEQPKREGKDRFNRSFEIQNNSFLQMDAPMASHLWTVPAEGGQARRITSGSWSLPITYPPGAPPPQPSWSPDGKTIAIERRPSAYSGDFDQNTIQLVDAETGRLARSRPGRITKRSRSSHRTGNTSRTGYPKGGQTKNNTEIVVGALGGRRRAQCDEHARPPRSDSDVDERQPIAVAGRCRRNAHRCLAAADRRPCAQAGFRAARRRGRVRQPLGEHEQRWPSRVRREHSRPAERGCTGGRPRLPHPNG